MDLATVLKAIEIAGGVTPAAMELYRGFIGETEGADQDDLKRRYAAARTKSDELHQDVQAALTR